MKTDIEDLVAKIEEIREGLKQTLRTLNEKIKMLETERSSLLVEIEKLKKVARSRVNSLETEVRWLREELRSMRELLGASGETD
ncbi:MAG: hypothetical protein NWE84_03090 [Candidatus Bathyarchaeota archaeon]|nr:hypothetical protein [Candidatus Bathyarchaeota archaeon]